jgi:hypothetical protein
MVLRQIQQSIRSVVRPRRSSRQGASDVLPRLDRSWGQWSVAEFTHTQFADGVVCGKVSGVSVSWRRRGKATRRGSRVSCRSYSQNLTARTPAAAAADVKFARAATSEGTNGYDMYSLRSGTPW